ncbi:MAG: hypothetical protein ACLQKA_10440 [Bryobacteraceae bacterium]
MTSGVPLQYAVIFVKGEPQVWPVGDGIEALAKSRGGRVIQVCPARETAEAMVKLLEMLMD